MSRRSEITLTDDELRELLEQERIVTIASNGRDGHPHLMPMWFVPREDGIYCWTYGKSQKVRNLERDPRCTLQIETGDSYDQLRGAMFKANAVLIRDLEQVAGIGADLSARYGGAEVTDEMREALLAQARKRVGITFQVTDTATWDHRKLGGGY